MTFCKFVETDDPARPKCAVCGVPKRKVVLNTPLHKLVRECIIGRKEGKDLAGIVALPKVKPRAGVGSLVSRILYERYKVAPCQRCRELIEEMDSKGVKWCEDNIDYLAEQMRQNAKKRWLFKLAASVGPLFTPLCRSVIQEAINKAKAGQRRVGDTLSAVDCKHLSNVRLEECGDCVSKVEVGDCALHGKCTLYGHDGKTHPCAFCKDLESAGN